MARVVPEGASLRILHIDPERGWGGGEEQVLGLVRHLKAMGHRTMVAAHPAGPLWRAAAAVGVEVYALEVRNAFDLGAARRLGELARHVDVVHFHTARAHALALWLRHDGARRVVTRRMDYPPRPRPYARVLYNRRVDAVVAISRRIRDVLVAAGVERERITVIPSGVETARFSGTVAARDATRQRLCGTQPTVPVVLVVGALVRRKGHAVLLEAARRLAGRGLGLHYVFCGEGNRRRDLERRVDRLGLGRWVHFTGWCDDVAQLLAAADLVALPSLHEGLGVAALEAMAAGLPVIASRTGGLTEAVVDGETGWLVTPDDPLALAEAIEDAVRNPALARRYGQAGRTRVCNQFSMEQMAEANEALYRQLAGGAA